MLDRFSVLAVQYQSLYEQLRPLLKLFVVHPKSVNAHNATSMVQALFTLRAQSTPLSHIPCVRTVLPIMLASKPLPEMEAADATLLSDIQTRYKGSLEAAYEPLSSAEDAHNVLVRFLTVAGGREGSGVLDAKVRGVFTLGTRMLTTTYHAQHSHHKGPLRTEITQLLRAGVHSRMGGPTAATSAAPGLSKSSTAGDALLQAFENGKGFR